jgi:hypothetical protein
MRDLMARQLERAEAENKKARHRPRFFCKTRDETVPRG